MAAARKPKTVTELLMLALARIEEAEEDLRSARALIRALIADKIGRAHV